jgi:hypothetical protein
MENNYIGETFDYGKSVIQPKRLENSLLHWPLPQHILKGYEHVRLTQDDALTVHLRELVTKKAEISIYLIC